MGDPIPTGTGVPLEMTGVEEWFDGLRRLWADPGLSPGTKLWRTLTNPVVMLAIFLIVAAIAILVMRFGPSRCKPCNVTTETPSASTEI